jgi:Uncharacterized protein conserved in bacteria (DUF2255)
VSCTSAQRAARPAAGTRGPCAAARGRIRASGLERDVAFTATEPGAHPATDAAYHAKYDRYGPAIVGSVVGEQARQVTIRLLPRT